MKVTIEQLQEFTDAELSEAVFIKEFGEEALERTVECTLCFDINNWSDMGALANKYGISAMYSSITEEWNAFSDCDIAEAWNKNELRAKAIVFLMMDNT